MPSSNEDQIGETPVETPTVRRSNRARVDKYFGYDFQLYLVEGSRDEIGPQYSYCYSIEEDPRTFYEAMQSRDVAFWKEAINDEMDSIIKNNTWILSNLPPGCKPLDCKWIFKRKMKVDGTIDKLLIALATTYNLVIHQMDVKTAFLNGDLKNEDQVDKTKEFLSSNFFMKDMGEADVILGIRIKREDKGITITQSHYIEKILKKFKCDDCCPVSTHLDPTIKLMPNIGRAVDQLEYSRAIGCLMYAKTSTRPDIAYIVGKLSRYTSNPSTCQWHAIMRVFKYLKKTMDYGLSYIGFPSVLEGYYDASWINNSEDHTSTTVLAATGKEAEWLRNLIYEIPLCPKPISPISIHCDSAATLAKAYCQVYNGKSRHLGVRHSMVRKLITNGVIFVDFIRSQQNLADHLTKGLARDLVHKSAIGMGLKSIEISNDETSNSLIANV
ncbi:zinc finger, CCHC-type containing protein [Tanacetum coccineum]|uniref:Zinc finger, CCHC-type containing protein n=1 Tax=Tanacetum coccineum TaxID=301880 RepID=A0ABQ5DD98_9ASTR